MFFRILQVRCVSHDMRSTNDYREILSDPAIAESLLVKGDESKQLYPEIDFYQVKDTTNESEDRWAAAIQELAGTTDFFGSQPDTLTVYGRRVNVPWHHNGTAYFDFEDICEIPLAAADYISIASRYHTIIVDNVPALKVTQKNEARRLITLLDALYECRCRLLIRSETVPEDLFFADVRDQIHEEELQSLDQEMFSEVHQDLSSPFRPNVSSYKDNERQTTPEKAQQEKRQFAPNNNDESMISAESPQAEDPSNKFFPPTPAKQDFSKVSAFTGEDERFAYKRAVSRLREMTGSLRWIQGGEWLPVEAGNRPWETVESTQQADATREEKPVFDLPFRKRTDQPPMFDASHFWSMVEWGPGKRLKDDHAQKWIKGNTIYKIKG